MYAIYTKTRRNPYYLDDDELGKKLADQWLNNKLPAKVKLGAVAIESGQIKGIESGVNPKDDEDWFEKAMNDKKLSYTNYIRECDIEFEDYTKERRTRTPDSLAADLAVPKLVWLSATGTSSIPEDAARAIVERQRVYLERHPNVTRANPICYRDIVKEHTNPQWKNTVTAKAALAMVERVLSADKFA